MMTRLTPAEAIDRGLPASAAHLPLCPSCGKGELITAGDRAHCEACEWTGLLPDDGW